MSSLVSVIIVAYNSSQFIIETLESVSKQTWEEIELIITDDCSGDDTVEVSRNWLSEKGQRFVSTEILTTNKNTGISTNANRGLKAASGEWIKFLGADDTLRPKCIQDNMLFVKEHPGVKVQFSNLEVYNGTFEEQNLLTTTPGNKIPPGSILAPGRLASSQYRMLLVCDQIDFSPSVFLKRETLLSVGGFDERFKMLEDYPLWLNLTRNGHKLYFMDKVTVNYRRHAKAINNTGITYLINPNYFKTENFRKVYTYPNMPIDIRLNQRYIWYITQIFRCDWLNRNKKLFRILHSLLTTWLNPFKYFIWLRKRLNKELKNNEFYM
jgi:alpha-1,3-rhamnosyltransferase